MSNYRESEINGVAKTWRRAYCVSINNKYGVAPSAVFLEEDITLLPDNKTLVSGNSAVKAVLSDPTKTFDLLNPETNEVVGQATHGQVYAMLYSLYLAVAAERDISDQPVVEPIVEPPPEPPTAEE